MRAGDVARVHLAPEHIAFARRIAYRYRLKVPRTVPTELIVQAALIGAWDALRLIEQREQREGRSLERLERTRLMHVRVRGQIRDDLRSNDTAPRKHRGGMHTEARPLSIDAMPNWHERMASSTPTPEDEAIQNELVRHARAVPLARADRIITDRLYSRTRPENDHEVARALGVKRAHVEERHAFVIDRMRRHLAEPGEPANDTREAAGSIA
jgi:DNA-directed RNA polymerase specialized sigma subunit